LIHKNLIFISSINLEKSSTSFIPIPIASLDGDFPNPVPTLKIFLGGTPASNEDIISVSQLSPVTITCSGLYPKSRNASSHEDLFLCPYSSAQ
jgi:hypothetical protein